MINSTNHFVLKTSLDANYRESSGIVCGSVIKFHIVFVDMDVYVLI